MSTIITTTNNEGVDVNPQTPAEEKLEQAGFWKFYSNETYSGRSVVQWDNGGYAIGDDFIGNIGRGDTNIEKNNSARRAFYKCVVDLYGGFDKIPINVRTALKYSNYGFDNGNIKSGKPLSVRRIRKVITAILNNTETKTENSNDSSNDTSIYNAIEEEYNTKGDYQKLFDLSNFKNDAFQKIYVCFAECKNDIGKDKNKTKEGIKDKILEKISNEFYNDYEEIAKENNNKFEELLGELGSVIENDSRNNYLTREPNRGCENWCINLEVIKNSVSDETKKTNILNCIRELLNLQKQAKSYRQFILLLKSATEKEDSGVAVTEQKKINRLEGSTNNQNNQNNQNIQIQEVNKVNTNEKSVKPEESSLDVSQNITIIKKDNLQQAVNNNQTTNKSERGVFDTVIENEKKYTINDSNTPPEDGAPRLSKIDLKKFYDGDSNGACYKCTNERKNNLLRALFYQALSEEIRLYKNKKTSQEGNTINLNIEGPNNVVENNNNRGNNSGLDIKEENKDDKEVGTNEEQEQAVQSKILNEDDIDYINDVISNKKIDVSIIKTLRINGEIENKNEVDKGLTKEAKKNKSENINEGDNRLTIDIQENKNEESKEFCLSDWPKEVRNAFEIDKYCLDRGRMNSGLPFEKENILDVLKAYDAYKVANQENR